MKQIINDIKPCLYKDGQESCYQTICGTHDTLLVTLCFNSLFNNSRLRNTNIQTLIYFGPFGKLQKSCQIVMLNGLTLSWRFQSSHSMPEPVQWSRNRSTTLLTQFPREKLFLTQQNKTRINYHFNKTSIFKFYLSLLSGQGFSVLLLSSLEGLTLFYCSIYSFLYDGITENKIVLLPIYKVKSTRNIARISKRCPENISSVVNVSSCFY